MLNFPIRERKKRKMLGIQLNFSGDCLVVCNGVVIGLLKEGNCEDDLGVLRILNNEYSEQIKLLKEGLLKHKEHNDYINSVSLMQGELVITVRYPVDDFRDTCEMHCYPLKIDNLIITYVKCKKAYVIKQSAVHIKNELKKLGVIK